MRCNTKKGKNKVHVVYVARYSGDVMYIGEGLPNREKHLTSGVSHVFEANKHFFSGKGLKIEIVAEGLNKDQAVEMETRLIEELQPKWNKLVPKSTDYSLSRGDKLKLLRYFTRRFKKLKMVDCVGHELLRLLVSKVDGKGYVELTGKQIKELSDGRVPNKFPSYLLESSNHRQYTYMDEFIVVRRPRGCTNVRSYQFTPEVMEVIGQSVRNATH